MAGQSFISSNRDDGRTEKMIGAMKAFWLKPVMVGADLPIEKLPKQLFILSIFATSTIVFLTLASFKDVVLALLSVAGICYYSARLFGYAERNGLISDALATARGDERSKGLLPDLFRSSFFAGRQASVIWTLIYIVALPLLVILIDLTIKNLSWKPLYISAVSLPSIPTAYHVSAALAGSLSRKLGTRAGLAISLAYLAALACSMAYLSLAPYAP